MQQESACKHLIFSDIIQSCVPKLNIQWVRLRQTMIFLLLLQSAIVTGIRSKVNRLLLLLALAQSPGWFYCVECLIAGLDNGLSLTPPMGWLSWERFRCNTDCDHDPEFCIGENLFKQVSSVTSYRHIVCSSRWQICWSLEATRILGMTRWSSTTVGWIIKGKCVYKCTRRYWIHTSYHCPARLCGIFVLYHHHIVLFRSPEGKLQPDPKRFPSGIPALADYIHKLGLKFGIYEVYINIYIIFPPFLLL